MENIHTYKIFSIGPGYYRVNYDEKNWMLLTDYLNTPNREKIQVANRIQLLLDVKQFHELGLLNLYPVLNSIEGLKHETEYAVLHYRFELINWLDIRLAPTEYHTSFRVKI